MTSIETCAPAKVNIFLKILNKRKDAYHNILTLFERISLRDRIRISKIPEGIIVSSDRFITRRPEDNLVYKTAELVMKRHRGIKGGLKIEIEKNIPIAAGLGGGSSDAAAVLTGMNRLFALGLERAELMRLAGLLGSDVPFFVFDAPFAVGRSRGERLQRTGLKIRPWHVIVYPGFKLSTKDVYASYDAHSKGLTSHPGDDKIGRQKMGSVDFGKLESMLYNDLEEIVLAKKRVIGRALKRLASSLGRKAIVSGSGPSVFCLCRTRKEALDTKRKLLRSVPARQRALWQVFVARTEE